VKKERMRVKLRLLLAALPLGLVVLAACDVAMPERESLLDNPIIDRRIKETPRDMTLRECKQETEHFRVECTFCHTTDKAGDIQQPDKLQFTELGKKARIMRHSPTFGLHNQCSTCHQSKFVLNAYAERLFGPKGSQQRLLDQESQQPIGK